MRTSSPSHHSSEDAASVGMPFSLPPPFTGRRFATLASTNGEAKRLAAGGDKAAFDNLVIIADQQTAGYGRRGRTWLAPPGNLSASLLLFPTLMPAEAARMGFLAALALAEALAPYAGGRVVSLKWPNDVLLEGHKIAGVLLESSVEDGSLAWLVVGIGVNICAFPDGVAYPATCLVPEGLDDAAARALGEDILGGFCRAFEAWRQEVAAKGFAPAREAWLALGPAPETLLAVQGGADAVTGTFDGLDEDGSLLLRTRAGVRRITAGDVFPLAAGEEEAKEGE